MVLNLEVSTKLFNTIEGNKKILPQATYVLATQIAGHLVRILDHRDDIILSPEYEHLLETMALQDIPYMFDQLKNIPDRNPALYKEATDTLHSQLAVIFKKVEEIKEEYTKDLITAMKANDSFISAKYELKTEKTKNGDIITGTKATQTNQLAAGSTLLSELNTLTKQKSAQQKSVKKKWWNS